MKIVITSMSPEGDYGLESFFKKKTKEDRAASMLAKQTLTKDPVCITVAFRNKHFLNLLGKINQTKDMDYFFLNVFREEITRTGLVEGKDFEMELQK